MTLPAAANWSPYLREQFMRGQMVVESAATGFSGLRNDFSTALVVLMCMVGLVLFIACANVANLLIARAFMRQKEIALRLSLGASRGRLVRQLLAESLVLSCAGGLVGIGLSLLLTRSLLSLDARRQHAAPDLAQSRPANPAFTLALTFVTRIVFGLLPACARAVRIRGARSRRPSGPIAGSGGGCSCARDWWPHRWRSASCYSSARGCSSAASRT
jgi:ABC-type lipoprotein release transport system permease subunit